MGTVKVRKAVGLRLLIHHLTKIKTNNYMTSSTDTKKKNLTKLSNHDKNPQRRNREKLLH
jgi:hypothetical protein